MFYISAAKEFTRLTKKTIPKITGLDPVSGFCFPKSCKTYFFTNV